MANILAWTAGAYFVIGAVIVVAAFRLWWMHPLERAMTLGPYVTVQGLTVLLRRWPLVFLLGAMIFASAGTRIANWLAHRGLAPVDLKQDIALIEAAAATGAAFYLLSIIGRGVRRKWKA